MCGASPLNCWQDVENQCVIFKDAGNDFAYTRASRICVQAPDFPPLGMNEVHITLAPHAVCVNPCSYGIDGWKLGANASLFSDSRDDSVDAHDANVHKSNVNCATWDIAHLSTPAPTDDAIWGSVKGCAMIEKLQEQIDRTKGEDKAELEARLAKLKQDISDWEEITSVYSGTDVWDDS